MKINFFKNWNGKLDKKEFTTIRKNKYWVGKVGSIEVYLSGKLKRTMNLIEVLRVPLGSIDEELVCADTGLDYEKSLDLFRNTFHIGKDEMVSLLRFKEVLK